MDLLQVTNRHLTHWTTNCHSNLCRLFTGFRKALCHLFAGFRKASANQRATRANCSMDPRFLWRLGSCHPTLALPSFYWLLKRLSKAKSYTCRLLFRHVISVTSSPSGLTWTWNGKPMFFYFMYNNICNVSGVWTEQLVCSLFHFYRWKHPRLFLNMIRINIVYYNILENVKTTQLHLTFPAEKLLSLICIFQLCASCMCVHARISCLWRDIPSLMMFLNGL